MAAGRREGVRSHARRRICYLVVVLQKVHEVRRTCASRRAAANQPLTCVPLPLVQVAVSDRGNQFLRRASVVAVISFGVSGGGNTRGVMEVVVPNAIRAPAATVGWPGLMAAVPFVFAHNNDRPPPGGGPSPSRKLRNYMLFRVVHDRVRGIDPQPVHVKLAHPVGSVLGNELADLFAVFAVKV